MESINNNNRKNGKMKKRRKILYLYMGVEKKKRGKV